MLHTRPVMELRVSNIGVSSVHVGCSIACLHECNVRPGSCLYECKAVVYWPCLYHWLTVRHMSTTLTMSCKLS